MAEIKSFPNNQDEYIGAEDVMRWHHGRTSGVFGEYWCARVGAKLDSMSVYVQDGTGWLADADGNGIVWWIDNEKQTDSKLELAVDMADAVLPRIDRVVVSWQTTNYVSRPEIIILKGTSASNPVPPALTNDNLVRQISLAQIHIPAGANSMNVCVVVDERLDPSVCGIVTEQVGIDTSVMQAQFEGFMQESIAEQNAYIEEQTQKWDAFYGHVQEDTIVPVPGASDNGKAVIVGEDGVYALANIQTEIPITSEVPAEADMWIDPNEPSGAVELGFDSGDLPSGTQVYEFPNNTAKFAIVSVRKGTEVYTAIIDCEMILHENLSFDLPEGWGGSVMAIINDDGEITIGLGLGTIDGVYISRVCGYGYVGGDTPNNESTDPDCHAEYFTITEDGVLSLKPEFRGMPAKNTYPDAISDRGVGVAGSRNAELPEHLVIPEIVEIPGIIGEVAVARIADGAFYGNTAIKTVVLPKTIKTIPAYCFRDADNLECVYNTEHITSVGAWAFYETSIKKIELPSLLTIGSGAFCQCSCLTLANIGKVTEIPNDVFFKCRLLSRVDSENLVTSVGVTAFQNTNRLVNADFVKNLKSIGAGAFICSGVDYDWASLEGCSFGNNATSLQYNPTDFWSACNPTPCENALPTLLTQFDTRWKDRPVGNSGKKWGVGCVLFSVMHAYCGMNNLHLESVEEFEDIVNEIAPGHLDTFVSSVTEVSAFAPPLGITVTDYAEFNQANLQALYDALAAGKYAIIRTSGGSTSGKMTGHAILAFGVTSSGKIMFADSDYRYSTDQTSGVTYPLHYKTVSAAKFSDIAETFCILEKTQ